MSSSVKTSGPTLGRVLMITITSLMLFIGMSGFVPMKQQKMNSESQTGMTATLLSDVATIASHNLLVDKDELRCLSLNIYFEARSESLDGQLAVAGVTMNRVADPKFPNTICGVVTHSRSKTRLHGCQFSWWCDGKKDQPKEDVAWANAQQLARLFLAGIYQDPTDNALWYHADYVKPDWASRMQKTAKIGRHIFYRQGEPQQLAMN